MAVSHIHMSIAAEVVSHPLQRKKSGALEETTQHFFSGFIPPWKFKPSNFIPVRNVIFGWLSLPFLTSTSPGKTPIELFSSQNKCSPTPQKVAPKSQAFHTQHFELWNPYELKKAPSGNLWHNYGKSPLIGSVNHLFLWAMASTANCNKLPEGIYQFIPLEYHLVIHLGIP